MKNITWNEKADAKLLAGILAINPNPIDFNALAAYMGDGVTVSALRHRISRLRARASELNDEGASSTPTSPAAKRKRNTPKKSAKGAAAKSKEAGTESGGEGPVPKDVGTDAGDAKDKKLKMKHEDTEDDPFLDSSLSKEEDTSDI